MPDTNNDEDKRIALKSTVFRLWDKDCDGVLKREEMLQVARCVGFDGSEEEWGEEYIQVCAENSCNPDQGMSEDAIMKLLDDKSETGCWLSNSALEKVLENGLEEEAPSLPADLGPPPTTATASDDGPAPVGGAPLDRAALKRRTYTLWDEDRDGHLKQKEMMKLAQCMGFEGTVDEWAEMYVEMCEQHGCSIEKGFSQEKVLQLLDDDSDNGCFVSTEELRELLAAATADEDVIMEDAAANEAAAAAAASPPPSAAADGESSAPDTKDATAPASGSDDAKSADTAANGNSAGAEAATPAAEAATAPSTENGTAGEADKDVEKEKGPEEKKETAPVKGKDAQEDSKMRESLKKRVFLLWDSDGDGNLKKDELLKLARHVGFGGSGDDWTNEYEQMCTQRGCTARYGLSEEAFNAFIDDESEMGCYFSNEELAKILAEADANAAATKKNLIMLCDTDGKLKRDEMLKIADWVGFIGEKDEQKNQWCKEFSQVVSDGIGSPKAGLSKEAVTALAERTKSKLPTELFKKEAGDAASKKMSWRQKRQQGVQTDKKTGVVGPGGGPANKKGRTVAPPSKEEMEKAAAEAAESKKIKCDGCESQPAALAVIRCFNCEAYLCAKCNEANHPTVLLKKHTRQPLVQDGVDAYNRFKFLFKVGEQWTLTTSVALWRHEWGFEKVGGINAITPWGGPNAFQILECGQKRLRVRGTRGGGANVGWLDVNLVVNRASGELMIRPLTLPKK